MKEHIKISLQWGSIGGLCMAIFRFIIYLIAPLSIGKWDNAYYLPLLFCMIWGVVTLKRNQGGTITFGRALLVTFLISTIGVLINTLFAWILFKIIDPDLGVRLYNIAMEKAQEAWEKKGLTQEQMDNAKKWIDFFFKSPAGMCLLFVYQVLIGTIISLVISAFVRQSSQPPAPMPENPNPTS